MLALGVLRLQWVALVATDVGGGRGAYQCPCPWGMPTALLTPLPPRAGEVPGCEVRSEEASWHGAWRLKLCTSQSVGSSTGSTSDLSPS